MGMTAILLVSFCVYSVIGWTIDTAHRSYQAGRFARGGFSRFPFSPIYGFGALLAIAMAPFLRQWPLWAEGLAYVLVMGAYEYASGVIVVRTLRRRLWDYTGEFMAINGHTSPVYALIWGLLSLFLVHIMHPFLLRSLAAI